MVKEDKKQLNLEGEICPYTLIKTIKKVNELEKELRAGEKVLKVYIDHPPAVDNLPEEFEAKGYKVETEKLDSGDWEVTISFPRSEP